MSIAYACILIAALLPYLWTTLAKLGGGYDNHHPRTWLAQLQGRRQRAYAAHLNAFEAFPLFAAAVLMAQLAGVDPARITMLAVVFVLARVAHGLLYMADMAGSRSLAWLIGIVCVLTLMVQAALRVA